ncbi:MAG: helix-turn-helix domain-containing protein [Eubacteriales bacterium]
MIFHQLDNSIGDNVFNTRIFSDFKHFAHIHKSYELIYVIKGSFECIVDNKTYNLKENECAMIFPYQIHSWKISSNGEIYIVVFSEDFVKHFTNITASQVSKNPVFKCSEEVAPYFLKSLYVKYPNYSGKPDRQMTMQIKSCLYGILGDFLRQADFDSSPSSDTNNLMVGILNYISTHFNENISLQSISKELGYSYQYVSKSFNQYVQTNFKTLLNQYRFEYAKQLLSETSKSISEIAFESGFQSIRNFNYVFYSFTNLTPREFRNKL